MSQHPSLREAGPDPSDALFEAALQRTL